MNVLVKVQLIVFAICVATPISVQAAAPKVEVPVITQTPRIAQWQGAVEGGRQVVESCTRMRCQEWFPGLINLGDGYIQDRNQEEWETSGPGKGRSTIGGHSEAPESHWYNPFSW